MADNSTYFSWSYPAQKFAEAADTLARSFAPGWQRMLWALDPIAYVKPEHFPEQDLYVRLERMLDSAREFGPQYIGGRMYQGSFEHTLKRRKRVTLERYANEIMNIYEEIESRRGDYDPSKSGDTTSMNQSEMTAKIEAGDGFIAALDQSGGSTPK
ncbi:MAG: hypothetical protein H0U34_00295, partial [Sphingomonas sp.]|nr:hypothetical protein [Sphingomonas sp.]